MSGVAKWKIHLAAHGVNSTLERDGVRVENACAVRVETSVNEATTVLVKYTNCEVEIEGEGVGTTWVDTTPFGSQHKIDPPAPEGEK